MHASRSTSYRRTKNLRAVQLLLGRSKLESTVPYLGIEVDDALGQRGLSQLLSFAARSLLARPRATVSGDDLVQFAGSPRPLGDFPGGL